MLQLHGSPAPARSGWPGALLAHPVTALLLLGTSVAGWIFLAWLALDMGTPLAQLVMPMTADWSLASVLAVWTMWSVMMVAMMLPAALPMILTFVQLARRNGERGRAHAFVAAYVLVWLAFGAAGTAGQWALQRYGALDAMALQSSAAPAALLLAIAGLYQFSPLKRVCLSSCRTPLAFLIGDWRPGLRGAWQMGLRHGLLCLGCCWALMALLFVGGVMNLAWVAVLAATVAIEKLAPGGERIGRWLGVALIAAASIRWVLS
jgi:predicted metal-binding membrane protein